MELDSVQPLTDENANPLQFGSPPWRDRAARALGMAAAATAFAAAVAALAATPALLAPAAAAAVGGAALLVAGLCAAALLWRETLTLDVRARSYRYVRGFRGRQKVVAGSLDDVRRVELTVFACLDATGSPDPRCTLCLRTGDGAVPIARGLPAEEARGLADALAERVPCPVQTLVPSPSHPGSPARLHGAIVGAVWLSLLSVVVVMLWPTLRHPSSLLAGWSHPAPEAPSPGSQQADLARQLYWNGRLGDAETALQQIVRNHPLDSESWNTLAYVYADEGKLHDAMVAAEEAHRAAPLSGYILDTVGEMHERRGELRDAVAWYEWALVRLIPYDTAETQAKLGRTLLAMHRRRAAIPHLQQAVRLGRGQWSDLANRLLKEAGAPVPKQPPARPQLGGPRWAAP